MYSELVCTGRSVRNILELFGKVEWGSTGVIIENDDDWKYPPVILWRYKEKDERRDQLIVNAVKSFSGDIQWTISFRDRESLPGRNWWITPKQFEEFLDEVKDNPDIIDTKGAFADAEPEIGKAANQELPDLAEHIKRFVQQGLGSKALT
jgi:hypothetical protein